jgi:hypothetical protein
VDFQVSVASDQRDFHIGETIPLRLAFSSTVANRYQINMAQYDRSGRMNYEQFVLSPANGAVDPLEGHLGGFGGGLTGFKFLTPEPWTITLNLNEWLRFTQPGDYTLNVISNRAGVKDASHPFGASPITVHSIAITLHIVPTTEEWQKRIPTTAVATLDHAAPQKPEDLESYTKLRRQALETLRFLGTPDAVKELAKHLRGDELGGLEYVSMLGLISSPDRAVAQSALEHELVDPDHPISQNFLYAFPIVSDPDPSGKDWRVSESRVLEFLISALPDRRGNALAVGLSTAVNQAGTSTSRSRPRRS